MKERSCGEEWKGGGVREESGETQEKGRPGRREERVLSAA